MHLRLAVRMKSRLWTPTRRRPGWAVHQTGSAWTMQERGCPLKGAGRQGGQCHHQPSPRGGPTGTQGESSRVPRGPWPLLAPPVGEACNSSTGWAGGPTKLTLAPGKVGFTFPKVSIWRRRQWKPGFSPEALASCRMLAHQLTPS